MHARISNDKNETLRVRDRSIRHKHVTNCVRIKSREYKLHTRDILL